MSETRAVEKVARWVLAVIFGGCALLCLVAIPFTIGLSIPFLLVFLGLTVYLVQPPGESPSSDADGLVRFGAFLLGLVVLFFVCAGIYKVIVYGP